LIDKSDLITFLIKIEKFKDETYNEKKKKEFEIILKKFFDNYKSLYNGVIIFLFFFLKNYQN